MADTLRVQYFGTNVGKIYFTDFDKRSYSICNVVDYNI